jgi:hypothetical protein
MCFGDELIGDKLIYHLSHTSNPKHLMLLN